MELFALTERFVCADLGNNNNKKTISYRYIAANKTAEISNVHIIKYIFSRMCPAMNIHTIVTRSGIGIGSTQQHYGIAIKF